ncbi:peptide synthase (plasmid) [Thioalkalivibrio sp. K90mix]|nr:peptide synthase [Thioalkalivibrio sp. K90mix]
MTMPQTIYLQGDPEACPEVTWCVDRIHDTDAAYIHEDRHRALLEALQNVMGHLDTPIGRRRLGLDPNEPWLRGARDRVESELRAQETLEGR